jgi:Fe-Mn family superoxide dismutase
MFTVPALTYAYDALGEAISADIMELHHSKHHQAYVDKLNAAIEPYPELADKTIVQLISDLDQLPEAIQGAVRNHGGGHYNHSLFWNVLSPHGGGEPSGPLLDGIVEKHGSYQNFVDEFTKSALGVFGSGWVWLQPDLSIVATANQSEPLMGLDVWEHAYYLDYKNKRGDYIDAFWKVVDWDFAAERYAQLAQS